VLNPKLDQNASIFTRRVAKSLHGRVLEPLDMARKRKFVLQRMENVKKGREALGNGKRRKVEGKENIPVRSSSP
jgi:hypothetical protein